MWPSLLISIYCVLVVVASLLGGWLPSLIRLTHTRMQIMMSLVGGLMMGVALLHLLPHAAIQTQSLNVAAVSAVLGLLAMFFTIRIFHLHGHEPHQDVLENGDSCGHTHDHDHEAGHAHELSWVGLFIGFAVHTLIDGIALAASVAVGAEESATFGLIGAGTFLAVVLHKPLDALSITSVMVAGGWTPRWRSAVNAVFSLMCPIGALAFFFGIQSFAGATHLIVGCALGFAAGAFLCISLADVLPEVQFHRHDRLKLSAALLLGVLIAWLIGFAEPKHAHDAQEMLPSHTHQTGGSEAFQSTDHDGHDH